MTVVRDLKVKLRINVLLIEMGERGSSKAGRDKGQGHIISSMPEITVDKEELDRRLADAALVLAEGWELDNDGPPVIVTGGVTLLTKNTVTLNAHVTASGQTTCGFMVDTLKDVSAASHDADQSPVNALASIGISHALAGLTPGTKYYYRPWAQVAGQNVRYGTVRSFTTPLV